MSSRSCFIAGSTGPGPGVRRRRASTPFSGHELGAEASLGDGVGLASAAALAHPVYLRRHDRAMVLLKDPPKWVGGTNPSGLISGDGRYVASYSAATNLVQRSA